uniref:Ovule protein n=1 Tax=Gongylonema pulchrum TaxID=637853 RepID=A0A183EYU7_9BILA
LRSLKQQRHYFEKSSPKVPMRTKSRAEIGAQRVALSLSHYSSHSSVRALRRRKILV